MISLNRFIRRHRRGLDQFLGQSHGVVHVGANNGAERFEYAKLGLRVLWIEPIPDVARTLTDNLAKLPLQQAVEYLVAETDGAERTLHIASNRGASSSMLELAEHKRMWPDVEYVDGLTMQTVTLPTLLQREGVELSAYDALVIDTQGAELLVLEGARPLLDHFAFIKTEAPDFEAYAGCPRVEDIDAFMTGHGFNEHCRRRFATQTDLGSYYDIVYRRGS